MNFKIYVIITVGPATFNSPEPPRVTTDLIEYDNLHRAEQAYSALLIESQRNRSIQAIKLWE